jgi:hypothetical protein
MLYGTGERRRRMFKGLRLRGMVLTGLLAASVIAGCTTPPGSYPVSGDPCAEGDPVLDRPSDCVVPTR